MRYVIIMVLLFVGIVNASLDDGLLAYYPFCGNASDMSGNGFDGVVENATLAVDRFGTENGSYHFNADAFIDIGNSGQSFLDRSAM